MFKAEKYNPGTSLKEVAMFFKKKKKEEGDAPVTAAQQREILESLNKDHGKMCKRFAFPIYLCQSASFIFMALVIPEAALNKEWLFLIFASLSTAALLAPFIYMASESEYWKQVKKMSMGN